jgi:molybdate transport system substrate-binding protein
MERQIAAIVKVQLGTGAMNPASPTKIRVQCTNGLKSVLTAVKDDLLHQCDIELVAEFGSTKKLGEMIAAGEVGDVVILTDEAIDALIDRSRLAPGRIDIARSFIGVAVRKGFPHPDIETKATFIQTLKSARSISRSRLGISGLHIASMLEQLGLAEELAPKIKVYDGYAAQACAEGQTDLAIQQISELMPVSGLDIVGPLPEELQKVTIFSAGLAAASKQRAAGEKFIAYLTAAERAPILRGNGLEPA